jgi:hypothetical protein
MTFAPGDPIDSLDLTGGRRNIQPRRDGMVWGAIQQLIEDSGQRVRG